jgi:AraC-like DNA-binding protein
MSSSQKAPFLLVTEIPTLFFRQKIKLWYDDFTGEFYPPDRPIYNKRMHGTYSLHYVIEGEGYLGIGDDEVQRLCAGDMFFIPPGSMMRYYPSRERPWKYCGISTNGSEAGAFFLQLGFSGVTVFKHSKMTDSIGQTIQSTIQVQREKAFFHYDLLGCLCHVFSLLENAYRQERTADTPSALYAERAKEYLELHYSEPTLRMTDLARAMNLSHPYLCRVFRRHVGVSAETYLRQYRMSMAERLLREQHYTVREASLLCGYTDPAQFSRMYKKEHGISPLQAAKQG